MVARPWLRVGALVVSVAACGGESRSHGDVPAGNAAAGAPGVGGGAGSGWILPTKDGIPVGDCTEPGASELSSEDCPASEADGGACAVTQEGAVCRYAIDTHPEFMSATQDYTVCLDGRWVPGGQTCSDACHAAAAGFDSTHFDASDCASRAQLSCPPVDATVVPRPTAQNSMDDELERLIDSCGNFPVYSPGVEIDFENGCPSALLTSSQLDPNLVACLVSKLTGIRYVCAVPLRCSFWSQIAI